MSTMTIPQNFMNLRKLRSTIFVGLMVAGIAHSQTFKFSDEEKAANESLTELARASCNEQALDGDESEESEEKSAGKKPANPAARKGGNSRN